MAERNDGTKIVFTPRNNTDLQLPVNQLPPAAERSLFSRREKALLILFVVATVGGSLVVTFYNHIAPMPSWP